MEEISQSRPFGLSDVLLLVAATALGLAITRSLADFVAIDRSESINYTNGPTSLGHRTTLSRAYVEIGPIPASQISHVRLWIERAAFWPCPCLAAWTLAVWARAALAPRRLRFMSLRQPGIMVGVACVAAFCVAALESPGMLVTWSPRTAPLTLHWKDWWTFTWFMLPRAAGYSVALTWLVLILSGRWESDRGWLNRVGIFLGLSWISLGLLTVSGSWVMLLL